MRRRIVDFWVGGALFAAAVIWLWLVWSTIPAGGFEGAPGPRAFPLLLGALLGGLGLILAFASGRSAAADPSEAPWVEPARRDEIAVVGGGFVLFLLYPYLMERIGFLLATPVVVLLALRAVLGIRDWFGSLLIAGALSVGCYAVFGVLMQAHLPSGSWLRSIGY